MLLRKVLFVLSKEKLFSKLFFIESWNDGGDKYTLCWGEFGHKLPLSRLVSPPTLGTNLYLLAYANYSIFSKDSTRDVLWGDTWQDKL